MWWGLFSATTTNFSPKRLEMAELLHFPISLGSHLVFLWNSGSKSLNCGITILNIRSTQTSFIVFTICCSSFQEKLLNNNPVILCQLENEEFTHKLEIISTPLFLIKGFCFFELGGSACTDQDAPHTWQNVLKSTK